MEMGDEFFERIYLGLTFHEQADRGDAAVPTVVNNVVNNFGN